MMFVALILIISILYKTNSTECVLETNKIWTKYHEYLKVSKTITLSRLTMENHNEEVDDFAKYLIQTIDNHSIMIRHHVLRQKYIKSKLVSTVNIRYVRKHSFAKNGHVTPLLSTFDLHIFVAKNEHVFQQFLYQNASMPPKPLYMLLFLYSGAQTCQISMTSAQLVKYLWKKYGILNAIVSAPCSCRPHYTYTYRPFEKIDNGWGRVRVGENNFPNAKTLNDLNKKPFKVSAFERIPSLIFDGKKIRGMDYNVLRTLSDHMNFTLEFDEDRQVYFGNVLTNGSVTGSLGKIVRGEVDMGGNHRFIDDPGSADYQYTLPTITDDLCIIVPKAGRKPRWLAVLGCFQWDVWLYIFVSHVICAITWNICKKLVEREIDYTKACLEIFAIAFSVPIKVKKDYRSRLVLSICLFLNIVAVSVFQGSYVKSLNIVQYYKEMDTLEEFVHSDYQIYTTLVNVFDGIDSVTYSKLKERVFDSSKDGISSVLRTANSSNVAALSSRKKAEIIEKIYRDSDGNPIFHMIRQCPVTFLYGYVLRKNSPFIPKISAILQHLMEGGWMNKWSNDDYQHNLVDRFGKKYRPDIEYRGLDLTSIQVALYIFIGGITLSILVFSLELYWCHIKLFLGI